GRGEVRDFAEHSGARDLDFGAVDEFQARLVGSAKFVCAGKDGRGFAGSDEPRDFAAARRTGDRLKFFRTNSENRRAELSNGFAAMKPSARFSAIAAGALALAIAAASLKSPRA